MSEDRGSVRIQPADEGQRLDVFLASLTGLSRNRVQGLISDGRVFINGKPARKNHLLGVDEEVSWELPPREPEKVTPEDIDLNVVYEDESIVVLDKPAGMVMYPGPGHSGKTLLNALLSRYPDIAGVGGAGRPGMFHRLDRDTSGLVAVARTEGAYLAMVEKVKNREVEREYLALVTGEITGEGGRIDAPMGRSVSNRKRMSVRQYGGRRAVTDFKVTERFSREYTLVKVSLETGRTHQIRVHLSHIGHPVAGDPEYSRGKGRRELGLSRQFLHACRLRFSHPVTGEPLVFISELPDDLNQVLYYLRSTSTA
jgi:23S rRNA pseudouridine1911/1915/1917 synthase